MPPRRSPVDRIRSALQRNEALLARHNRSIETTRDRERRAALIADARKIRRFSEDLRRRLAELTGTEHDAHHLEDGDPSRRAAQEGRASQ